MDDLASPRRQAASLDGASVDAELAGNTAQIEDVQEDLDIQRILQLAKEQETEPAPTASDQAFGGAQAGAPPAAAPHAAPQTAAKKHPPNSQSGGFLGFGAEFNPYSYTDAHENHHKLDPEVRALHTQHTRMIIPGAVISTGMLGAAGPDFVKQGLDKLKTQLAADPNNTALQKKVNDYEKQYQQDISFVQSFQKTMELAGKHTTINLTFCGATGQPNHVDLFANVVRYLIGQGYTGLQLTLENEPNGPDKGDGFRGHFNHGEKTGNQAEARAAAQEYVDAYARLNQDLADQNKGNVRNSVQIVGGDMVGNRRTEFFKLITKLGLNQYVDAYSFHIYWGANKGLKSTLQQLIAIKKLAHQVAPDKALQITEFGKEHFTTAAEKKKDGNLGADGTEKGPENAFEQALFALSAVNDGFVGVVKWDAFYGFKSTRHIDPQTHKKVGDPRGNYGNYYMIGGPNSGYATDAAYRLMRMFTHAVEPGWRCHGTNHGAEGAQALFQSPDGHQGAILAMAKAGGSVSTAGLPKGETLHVTTWNANKAGGLASHTVAHGESVHIPVGGAVAISTLG